MRRAALLLPLAAWVLSLRGSPAGAGDWPTWRCDARRSAACSEELADSLHPQWVLELPPAMLAWPNERRLHFDACYEPVVAGKTLLIGSPNDGSVTALDTETGAQRWKVFTEGPVRFAPVAWKEKVYVGSDDGFLYCLRLADGSLLWKVRGAPDDRPDRRHLGNNRLISFWPVRGGPVLADGVVYFGAGIWPTMGVFVVAVDAESGKVLWRNGDVGLIEKVRIDHNQVSLSGLSPQGYLAVEGDTLLVPNGRSMPAGLDRKTGRLLYYVQGYRNGECRVTVMEKYAFVGQAGVTDVATGREVGSRWLAAGKDAPAAFDPNKFDLFEGPMTPYKLFSGCSAWSALVPGAAYDLDRGVFAAYDLSQAKVSEQESKIMGRAAKPWRWDAPSLWTLPTDEAKKKPATSALIKAGKRLYGHTGQSVIALELPATAADKPKIAWQHKLAGTPATMLASDGRLFVVTREGRICCFGAGQGTELKPAPRATAQLAGDPGTTAQTAAEILKQSGVSEGYCLVLGLRNGFLLDELLKQSKLKLIGVGPDRKTVDALREYLSASSLYGTRAEVFVGDPQKFELPPYLASLVVSEGRSDRSDTSDGSDALPIGALFGVLRPYGGVACLAIPQQQQTAFEKQAAEARLENAEVHRAGDFVLLRRGGPLPGSAPWTHESADAARSFFSHDTRVKPPMAVLWYGDGDDHGFWKEHDYGTGVKPQVIGGRLFALQINMRTLYSYDAYTGRLLWKQKVDPFTRYASMDDGVYVAGGSRCAVLDPATGQERASFKLETEPGRPCFVADIRVGDDVIVVGVAPHKVRAIEKGLWDSTVLLALDRKSGKLLWKREAKDRFNNNALAIGAGMVFCIDSLSPMETEASKRLSEKGEMLPSTILALDARTGQTKWTKAPMNRYRSYPAEGWLGVQGHDDWLGYCRELGLLLVGKTGEAWVFEAASGSEVWHKKIGGAQPWMLCGETFIHQGGATFETRTGKQLAPPLILSRGGCNYSVASPYFLLQRDATVSMIDLRTRENQRLYAVRSGCSNSLIAADGLLNVPCFCVGCICNYPIQTSFAMVHLPESAVWLPKTPASQAYQPRREEPKPPGSVPAPK